MSVPPTDQVLAEIRAELAARDPALVRAHAEAPALSWRVRPGGFEGLVWMIVGQQVSTASAAAIWARFEAGLGAVTPETVRVRDIEGLRSLGLSLPKARYVHALAEAGFDATTVSGLDDAGATEALTALKGIGRWTAEVYLMFCEARPDIFPSGDVALQEAMRWADGLAERPGPDRVAARALAWGPHRSTAAHLLWAWYGAVRRGECPHPQRPDR
jgi:DNA-3-methyladenine glycosylase II